MNERIKYFAYGSNLDLEHLKNLGISIIGVEIAFLKNMKLVFNVVNHEVAGAGYANIVVEKGSIVEGLIIETDESSMKKLDHYEAYPDLYFKENVLAYCGDSGSVSVVVYKGNATQTHNGLKPTKEHLSQIMKGKKFFSRNYYENLRSINLVNGSGKVF